jgi:hypothetical protein
MYALVNTMSRTAGSFGKVYSKHRSVTAAVKADQETQRRIKRTCGPSSYLPFVIVELSNEHKGSDARRVTCKLVDDTEARAI